MVSENTHWRFEGHQTMLKSTYMIRWLLQGTYGNVDPVIAQRCVGTDLPLPITQKPKIQVRRREEFQLVLHTNFQVSLRFTGKVGSS